MGRDAKELRQIDRKLGPPVVQHHAVGKEKERQPKRDTQMGQQTTGAKGSSEAFVPTLSTAPPEPGFVCLVLLLLSQDDLAVLVVEACFDLRN